MVNSQPPGEKYATVSSRNFQLDFDGRSNIHTPSKAGGDNLGDGQPSPLHSLVLPFPIRSTSIKISIVCHRIAQVLPQKFLQRRPLQFSAPNHPATPPGCLLYFFHIVSYTSSSGSSSVLRSASRGSSLVSTSRPDRQITKVHPFEGRISIPFFSGFVWRPLHSEF